ncbi:MAG: DUF177 domain-containing protein [Magnetococcus sp. DMHC-8]
MAIRDDQPGADGPALHETPGEETDAPTREKRNLSDAGIDLNGVRRLFKRFHGFVPASRLLELAAEVTLEMDAEVDLLATFDATADGQLLRLQGRLACVVRLSCARCLTDFSTRLAIGLDRLFVPGPDPAGADSQQEMVEDLTYLPDYHLSIAAVVEEELLLALPMVPLCHPQCAGLCPGCGVDRNREACRCTENTADGPFAVLKKLKTF